MSTRWLVTLALAVVALPEAGSSAAAPGLRVERSTHTITTSRALAERSGPPRVAPLPASVEIDRDAVLVVTAHGLRVRHPLGHVGAVWWAVTAGPHVVIGFAARPGGQADTIVAIDHTTGRLAWRRTVDSVAAVPLAGALLAVARSGALDVIDARTGGTTGTAPLAGSGLQAVSRGPGDLLVKTHGDLIAIDRRTGAVRWRQPASALGNAAATPDAVVDAWVDRARHRFGVVRYDPRDGRPIASIDLGATSGWYDRERIDLAPDGHGDVLVSALFATA